MMPRSTHLPQTTNLLGDAVGEARQHFRQVLGSLERLIESNRLDEGRRHLPKLEALAGELRRVLNPRDPVDRKALAQIDRDVARIQKALRKGWGGVVGKGVAAVVVGAILGLALLIAIFVIAFT